MHLGKQYRIQINIYYTYYKQPFNLLVTDLELIGIVIRLIIMHYKRKIDYRHSRVFRVPPAQ